MENVYVVAVLNTVAAHSEQLAAALSAIGVADRSARVARVVTAFGERHEVVVGKRPGDAQAARLTALRHEVYLALAMCIGYKPMVTFELDGRTGQQLGWNCSSIREYAVAVAAAGLQAGDVE